MIFPRLTSLAAPVALAMLVTCASAHAQDRLLPQSRRITDEAIARDRALIASWRSRALALESGPAGRCTGSRAGELLAFVAREYDLNNRDAEVDSAFAEAVDLVAAQEQREQATPCPVLSVDTPRVAPPAPAPAAEPPRLSLPDAVHFSFDEARLGEVSGQVVDQVANLLRAEPALTLRLDAYTDPVGTAEWNRLLSERRGAAVQARLVEQGVAPARIRVVPHGEAASRHEGATRREQDAHDRRVEFTVEGQGSDRVAVVRQREDVQPGRGRRRSAP